ncbi:MAG: nicotinamide-nucleotide amidohydrolase family protein [Anaerolineaceae bacterium]|nr:nicotinamide-nucleotide amidohydrolase family protein [Anaerolineaceae bacterium]
MRQTQLDEFAAQLEKKLINAGIWVAAAESCTGGLITHTLTNVAGSSACVLGGVAAYANEIKISLLGVAEATIKHHGAVSEETAIEMADGVRLRFSSALKEPAIVLGISTTGVAGPGGGTPQKPVGLVYIGLSTPIGSRAYRSIWTHDRIGNKLRSALTAMQLVDAFVESGKLPNIENLGA